MNVLPAPVAPLMSTCSFDPAAGDELPDDGLVEFPAGRVVDRFDAGVGELQLGLPERPPQALVLPGAPFGIDEQGEAVIEAERGGLRGLGLRGSGRRHGGELEGLQLFQRLGILTSVGDETGSWLRRGRRVGVEPRRGPGGPRSEAAGGREGPGLVG